MYDADEQLGTLLLRPLSNFGEVEMHNLYYLTRSSDGKKKKRQTLFTSFQWLMYMYSFVINYFSVGTI